MMAVSAVPPAPKRFTTLEAGRALAAALIVVHHATLLAAQPRWIGRFAFEGLPRFFDVGVDFFFVLSGFIITFVHWGDLGRPSALPAYARARLTRIYPLYWVILVPLVAVYAAFPTLGVERQREWSYVVSSFLLTPMPDQPVLGVAWSLTYEMLFYGLFAGAVLAGRGVLWLGLAWAGAIVLGASAGLRFPLDFLLDPRNLQFLMGVAAAAWLRTRRAPVPSLLLAVGLAWLLLIVGVVEPLRGCGRPIARALALGVPSALCVLGAVELERAGRLKAPAWLAALGGASYAVYLVHVLAESFSIRLLLDAGLRQPEAVVAALAVVGVAAGLLTHVALERPLLRALRPRPRAPPVAAAPSTSSP